MTIYPNRITTQIADLGSSRVERWASEGLRRNRAATPANPATRADARRDGEKVAEAEGENLPAPDDGTVLEPSIRQLSIRKDPEIDRVVVQVIDAQTGEVVRQIPSEEWVRHLKRLKGAKGLFVDQKG